MTDDPGSGARHEPSGPEPAAGGAEAARLREYLLAASELPVAGDAISAICAVRGRVRRRRLIGSGLTGCLVAGLVAVTLVVPGDRRRAVTPAAAPAPAPPAFRLTGALVSFNGCTDYLSYVRARALAIVGPYGLQQYGSYGQGSFGLDRGAPMPSNAVLGNAGAAASVSAAPAAPSAFPQASAGSFSQTNDQVAGVDEPDTVKTDGRHVVTLQGGTLRVLDTSAHVLGSLRIGDVGGGLLLAGDRAVVFTSSAGTTQGPTGLLEPSNYQPSQPASTGAAARAAVVDLSDPARPQLVRTFELDGTIVAARLVGQQLRLVLRSDGPRLTFANPSSQGDTAAATTANQQLIAASSLSDWLPAWQVESSDGSTTARHPLAACDAVARPQHPTGLSTLSVFSLDPQSDKPFPAASLVAAGDTVYATGDHLYVAGATQPTTDQSGLPVPYGCCSIAPPLGASTSIYAFETPAVGPPLFLGAGSVPGWLINSYAMDQDVHGRLRVASTSVSPAGVSGSQIAVLDPSATQLTTIGTVSGLGPGQYIRAVRFVGDQAYVVTFRSFDPLYVVDLRDPTNPVVAGQLEQPGYSEFLYPLPGGRLLSVGVQITDNEPWGLFVTTYDVTDPAHPSRLDSSALADGAQYTYQGYDPHAFLFWSPASLAFVAVPSNSSNSGNDGATAVAGYTIGTDGRLSRTATLAHGTVTASRTVVIGTQAWVITTAGVVTSDLADLQTTTWHPY